MSAVRTATYNELCGKHVVECGHPFVMVYLFDSTILCGVSHTVESLEEMLIGPYNDRFLVREPVAQQLQKVNKMIKFWIKNTVLYVSCGYRSPEQQRRTYLDNYLDAHLGTDASSQNKYPRNVTFPDVAGHPTGGAVDVTLFDTEARAFLDMGCKIGDFSKNNADSFSKNLTVAQMQNRAVLHHCMTEFGFCPFSEKWWHYSIGDREWAVRFGINHSIYSQVPSCDLLRIGR